ncbi:MAG TPA: flavodoxin domain-containing protein [Trebonia sp.]
MRALVVYESMYGNSRAVATDIAAGLSAAHEVTLVPVCRATRELVAAADLIVVGGPTHLRGMSTSRSRRMAAEAARKRGSRLVLDPDASGQGLRGWLDGLGPTEALAAAFDTRRDGPAILTGRASRRIARQLARAGRRLLAPPESFLVSKRETLLAGEAARARSWGAEIGEAAHEVFAPQKQS